MVKHRNNCNKILKIYKQLIDRGFMIERIKKGTKIIHIETNKFYIFHYSEKGYHPLRRWIKKNFAINI